LKKLLVLSCLFVLVACGAKQETKSSNDDRLSPLALYPLAEGNVWTYDIDMRLGEPPVFGNSRVISADGSTYEVAIVQGMDEEGNMRTSEPEVIQQKDGGLFLPQGGGWLLKAPIRDGATWPSRGGHTAKVVSTDVSVQTPAGAFKGCVRIDEEGAPSGVKNSSIYCAKVGLVQLKVEMISQLTGQTSGTTATLRAHIVQ